MLPSNPHAPTVATYKIIVHYPSKEIDIDTTRLS